MGLVVVFVVGFVVGVGSVVVTKMGSTKNDWGRRCFVFRCLRGAVGGACRLRWRWSRYSSVPSPRYSISHMQFFFFSYLHPPPFVPPTFARDRWRCPDSLPSSSSPASRRTPPFSTRARARQKTSPSTSWRRCGHGCHGGSMLVCLFPS